MDIIVWNSVQWTSTNYFATVQLVWNKSATRVQLIYAVVCKKCASNVEQFQADGGSHRGEKHTGTHGTRGHSCQLTFCSVQLPSSTTNPPQEETFQHFNLNSQIAKGRRSQVAIVNNKYQSFLGYLFWVNALNITVADGFTPVCLPNFWGFGK